MSNPWLDTNNRKEKTASLRLGQILLSRKPDWSNDSLAASICKEFSVNVKTANAIVIFSEDNDASEEYMNRFIESCQKKPEIDWLTLVLEGQEANFIE